MCLGLNATGYFECGRLSEVTRLGAGEIDDLATLLTSLQLTKYVDIFREQEVIVTYPFKTLKKRFLLFEDRPEDLFDIERR